MLCCECKNEIKTFGHIVDNEVVCRTCYEKLKKS